MILTLGMDVYELLSHRFFTNGDTVHRDQRTQHLGTFGLRYQRPALPFDAAS